MPHLQAKSTQRSLELRIDEILQEYPEGHVYILAFSVECLYERLVSYAIIQSLKHCHLSLEGSEKTQLRTDKIILQGMKQLTHPPKQFFVHP